MKFKGLQKKKRGGFTLVEMVIVVTIIGILSGLGFMKFGNVQETSRKNADYIAAANLATAVNLYMNEYPDEISKITEVDGKKEISLQNLKEKNYIDYIPKPQSEGTDFKIELKDGDIAITAKNGNNTCFYPK